MPLLARSTRVVAPSRWSRGRRGGCCRRGAAFVPCELQSESGKRAELFLGLLFAMHSSRAFARSSSTSRLLHVEQQQQQRVVAWRSPGCLRSSPRGDAELRSDRPNLIALARAKEEDLRRHAAPFRHAQRSPQLNLVHAGRLRSPQNGGQHARDALGVRRLHRSPRRHRRPRGLPHLEREEERRHPGARGTSTLASGARAAHSARARRTPRWHRRSAIGPFAASRSAGRAPPGEEGAATPSTHPQRACSPARTRARA